MKRLIMKKINKKLIFILLLIIIIFSFKSKSFANLSDYYSLLSEDELKEIFSLDREDISDPLAWISDVKTFILVQKINNDYIFWWNTPNLQGTLTNSLYDSLNLSGYGNGIGREASKDYWLVKLPDKRYAKTAMQLYGFNLQNPTYMGERPLITLSLVSVFIPDTIINIANRINAFFTPGSVTPLPIIKNAETLIYKAPRDYNNFEYSFEQWVDKYWYQALQNIKDDQILRTDVDQSTGKDETGCVWIKESIINMNGLDQPGLSAKYICNMLKYYCGSYFHDVAYNIILTSGIKNSFVVERIMPYDFDRLNSEDKKVVNYIKDPRAEMQKNLFDTGYGNVPKNLILYTSIIKLSSKLSELSIALNNMANFTYLNAIGLKPEIFWDSTILKTITIIMLIIIVCYCVYSVFCVAFGKKSVSVFIRQIIIMIFISLIIIGISMNPKQIYTSTTEVINSILTLSTQTLKYNTNLSPLFGTGSPSEIEQCELWLPYFNIWTSYHTNHTILDKSQLIDLNSNSPEVKNLQVPEISGVKQNLWSTILADAFVTEENYSGNIYRVVDHFMAPRITINKIEEGKIDINVKQNENYNGNIQSSIAWTGLLFQFIILILVVFKLFVFIELIINIIMFVYNASLSIINEFKLKGLIKDLGISIFNLFVVNVIKTLVVYTSLITSNMAAVIIAIAYIFIIFSIIKSFFNGTSYFTPKFFKYFRGLGLN